MRPHQSRLKLKLELVPEPLWGKNLRSKKYGLGKGRWDTLRRRIKNSGQTSCVICGGTERLHGHEVWKYIEWPKPQRSIARLLRVEMVCRRCHDINHWGNTSRLIVLGMIEHAGYLGLRKHFRTVNECTQKEFDRHVDISFAIHRRRSSKKWRIDWGDFKPALKQAKAARQAWAVRNPEHVSKSAAIKRPVPKQCPACRVVGPLKFKKIRNMDFLFCRACNSYVFWKR